MSALATFSGQSILALVIFIKIWNPPLLSDIAFFPHLTIMTCKYDLMTCKYDYVAL